MQVKGANGEGYLSDIVAISAGNNHSLALKSDGSLWSFGYNGYGQLGDGTTADRSLPVQVKGVNGSGNLTDVVSLAAGYLHSMALKSDGSAWSFGYNAYGQLGDGTVTNRTTPVQVKGGESGEEYLTDMMSVSGGNSHSAGVKKDGSVWGFGYNNYGQIGDGSAINRNAPVRVEGGGNDGLKLGYAEITYKGVAQKKYGEAGGYPRLPAVVRINAQQGFRVDAEKISKSEGFNLIHPEFKVASSKVKFKIMDKRIATVNDSGAVTPTGEAYGYTQLVISEEGNGEIIRVIPIGVMPKGAKAVPQVSGGSNITYALKSDGTLWSWGYNGHGELGIGDTANKIIPMQIALTDVVDISRRKHVIITRNRNYSPCLGLYCQYRIS